MPFSVLTSAVESVVSGMYSPACN